MPITPTKMNKNRIAGTKTHYFLIFSLIIGLTLIVLMVACQPARTAVALSSDSPAQVQFATSSAPQVYTFRANKKAATTLYFETQSANAPFSVELRDQTGAVVAQLDSGTLHTASLTIAPGDALYEARVASAEKNSPITLSIRATNPGLDSVPAPETAQTTARQPVAATVPVTYRTSRPLADVCRISTDNPAGINVHNGPGYAHTIVHSLPPENQARADLRTASGWYHITSDNIRGWINGNLVTLNGICDSLPFDTATLNNAAPQPGVVAPYDRDSYYLGIDHDAGGRMGEAISYPNGDSTDRILLSMAIPDGGFQARTFTLTLFCQGTGTEFVRWGMTQSPSLFCGDSFPLPFSTSQPEQHFVVMLPGATGQSYVDYVLLAEPTAPKDRDGFAFVLDRDRGGQFGEVISYPRGDQADAIQMQIANLKEDPAKRYREYHLTLLCSGTGAEHVRWGRPDNLSHQCNSTVLVSFNEATNLQQLLVALPDGSPQSFVNYAFRAEPAAPNDPDTFVFGIDRDGGGQFNETISYPVGDQLDVLQMAVTNLTARAPNNYREFNLTLHCGGIGVEHLRWGAPENPSLKCGQTIKLPFMHSLNQTLLMTVPDDSAQTYIYYTLVASPAG
jgi:hypothetical protein